MTEPQFADKQGALSGMKPPRTTRSKFHGRRLLLWSGLALLSGCTPHILGGIQGRNSDLEETLAESADDGVDLIGDYASPWGMNFLKVEGVALVNNLNGTGSNPADTPLRGRLIAEMDSHSVQSSSSVLAGPNTSLALVYGLVPPGAQKNDLFDVRVVTPSRSDTTSLDGGWLMPVRMQRMEMLGGALRSGDVSAQGVGPVLVDSMFEGDDDPTHEIRGRVLSGGKVLKPRQLGLVVRGEGHTIKLTAQMASAINYRFNTYDRGGARRGVATAKDDKILELEVPPQYRHYVTRYVGVVRNIALGESPAERIDRVERLEARLMDPKTAAVTALQLEGVGEEAVGTLEKALEAADPRVRFFAAEALAYLNQPSAIEPLAQAAAEPAFRWHAITALAAMDELDAADALAELFHTSSAETRYAAFRALRSRSAHDPLVKGELLNQKFYYHVVSTIGDPMVHVSRTRRQEIVLFGHDQKISPPGVLFAGSHIMLQGADAENVKVTRVYAGDQANEQRTCSTRLDEVIRTVVELGGGYPEVLAMLQESQTKGYLQSRLVIDALPRSGRRYYADQDGGQDAGQAEDSEQIEPAGPLPELFRTDNETGSGSLSDKEDEVSVLEEEAASGRGFFGRITGWLSD
ncbi:MAG: flagellar basal body P-ring protein FlgI [Pirellulaceae bacterium]